MPCSRANAARCIGARSEAVMIDRRSFLKYAGLVPVIGTAPRLALAADESTAEKADYTLRIGTGLVELAPDHIVSTTLYNGQFPGPLLRFREGQRATVDIYNDLVTVGGKPTAAIIKDVVMVGGYQEVEFDFFADNPGLTLFHCHQQLHMDFGFMALFDYV